MKNTCSILLKIILFCIFCFIEFITLELFFKQLFWNFELSIIIKNIALTAVPNLILLCVVHSMKYTFLISDIIYLLIGAANYFVILFRGYGIVFMDFYAIKTAAAVAGEYQFSIDIFFAAGLIISAAGIIACILIPHEKEAYFSKKNIIKSLINIVAVSIFLLWINTDATFFKGVSSLTWDHSIGMKDYGYPLYFLSNAGEASVDKPEGYSVEKVKNILQKYDDEKENVSYKNPNIIVIMNESFSDLRVLGDFQTNKAVMPFYDSLTKNTIKGYAQSSVYGGYTANSEFEFLTGCSKLFLPGNPYLQYIDDYLPSFAGNVKIQDSYKKAIAMHPFQGSGYNRNTVYPLLHFDEFITQKEFKNARYIRDYISDSSDYDMIKSIYEKKEKDTSLCLFNVTMQNHNPYDKVSDNFENSIRVTSFASSFNVNQYLSLMKESDSALKELITYFQTKKEPVILLIFGDHQPHLPDLFYEKVTGKNPLEYTAEDNMKKYIIPFMIWANYDIPEKQIKKTSINYLSSILSDAAGIKMSNYNRYLLDLSKQIPSISANGYYDKEGNYHDKNDTSGKYGELMKEYQMVQYNYLFDKEKRLEKYYTVSK